MRNDWALRGALVALAAIVSTSCSGGGGSTEPPPPEHFLNVTVVSPTASTVISQTDADGYKVSVSVNVSSDVSIPESNIVSEIGIESAYGRNPVLDVPASMSGKVSLRVSAQHPVTNKVTTRDVSFTLEAAKPTVVRTYCAREDLGGAEACPPLTATLKERGKSFTATSDQNGRIVLPAVFSDSAELRVAEVSFSKRFFPAVIYRLSREDAENVGIVLVPRSVVIPSGKYSGLRVQLDLATAMQADVSNSFLSAGILDGGWSYGWWSNPWESFQLTYPIQVGIDVSAVSGQITPAELDSIMRWVEEGDWELGTNAYTVVSLSEIMTGSDTWNGIKMNIVPSGHPEPANAACSIGPNSQFAHGRAYVSLVLQGHPYNTFKVGARSRESVKHELIHCLEIGHSHDWMPSVMGYTTPGNHPLNGIVQPIEVATIRIRDAVNKLLLENNAQYGIPAAHQGVLVIEQGQPLLPADHNIH